MKNMPNNMKLTQVMKDFDIKSKDLLAILAELGITKKSGASLDTDEFEALMQSLTLANQIENLDEYLSGKATILSSAKEAELTARAEQEAALERERKEAEEKARREAEEKAKEEARLAAEKQAAEEAARRAAEEKAAAEKRQKAEEEAARRAAEKAAAEAARKEAERKAQEKKAQKPALRVIDMSQAKTDEANREAVVVQAPKVRVVTKSAVSAEDLSKYDDTVADRFVSSSYSATTAKQKLKKQNNNNPQGGNPPRLGGKALRDKERAEKERQQREEAERARKKQLEITLPDEITVGELASRMKKTSAEVIKKLMTMGVMASVNQTVDYDTAFLLCDEMKIKATKEVVVTIEEKLFNEEEDDEKDLVPRPPVVCVMGHVDHGKTSLLDYIRNTHVTAREAGGITQHIGAYCVNVKGKEITFLDTPGHEAFTAMRARGAMATDIAILVVAADDGIMPQTVEAINHAKAAGIDIIVAINKMDKPHADPDRVKQELTNYELVPEEWGGDVICVPVSALTGQGIDDLLENVLLVAEVKDLKANPNRRAKGVIIESRLDKGRGPVATVLVQNGTLKVGDIVIAGTSVGRVRAMTNDQGKNVKTARPGTPVEIIGLAEVPSAGDEFNAVADEKMARSLAEQRRAKIKEESNHAKSAANLDDLFAQISDGVKKLDIIVKADVAGSVEAVKAALLKLSNDEVRVSVIHTGVGAITEGDVMLAAASNAIIVGFSVRPDKGATDSAERNGVDIRTYRVIYECIDEIEAAMKGMLAPVFKEAPQGRLEVRQLIHVPGVGMIAGCYVLDGKITRQSLVRVVRDGIVVFDRRPEEPVINDDNKDAEPQFSNRVGSLQRFKDSVREVAAGYECGLKIERFDDLKMGDIIEAYAMEKVAR